MDFKQYLREQDEPTDDELEKDSEEAGTKIKPKKKTLGDRVKAAAKAAKDAAEDEDVQKGAKKLAHQRGVGVQGSWGDDPQVQFKTMGKQGRGAEEDEEEQDKFADKVASRLKNEWKAPEGEPVLFERSKRGLERVIGSSRTSQLQKNKARKDLQKKRKAQIKRADKTADNPKTDLNTAIRAADASIDAKEKVKKFKAPPEKKKVKTDFGPPEKAFKD
mgnify:CR=1 FL=1